jgi:hypothetical protein
MNVHLDINLLQPAIALVAGILILLVPRLLNYVVAIYLILIGIAGLWPHLMRLPPPKLDFIEKYPASPSRLDVKDWFLPEDFVGPFKGEPEASEVSECTPAFPHVGPVEQLEAV